LEENHLTREHGRDQSLPANTGERGAITVLLVSGCYRSKRKEKKRNGLKITLDTNIQGDPEKQGPSRSPGGAAI